jgi:hypothetical protein
MKRSNLPWSLLALSLLAALVLATLFILPGRTAQAPPAGEVDKLIKQLGDKSPALREAASHRLVELAGADLALRAALKSPDPEIARRAALILTERSRRGLARMKEYAKNGEVDQAVELFVWRSNWEDDKACWQVLTGLAAGLIERGRKKFGAAVPPPHDTLPAGDFGRYLKEVRPLFLAGPRIDPRKERTFRNGNYGFVASGTDLILEGGGNHDRALLAATGSFRYAGYLHSSVIYAGGPVEMEGVYQSLLVCDGDLKMSGGCFRSLVIVQGDVYWSGSGSIGGESLVIITGRLHLGSKYTEIAKTAKVRERQPDLLGFVKFFDPTREGVEVEAAKGGVRVKAVDATKAFAKAGLRVGDVITAVDGQASANPEAFRRQLRSALAREGYTLQISSGNEARQIRMPAAEQRQKVPKQ